MKKYITKTQMMILAASLCGSGLSAQTLLYQYDFNDVDNTTSAVSTGSNTTAVTFNGAAVRGAAGSGVSGQAGDYAFDLSSTNAMGNQATVNANNGASAPNGSGVSGFGGSTSFTWTGWFKADTTLGNFARAFYIGTTDGVLFSQSTTIRGNVRQTTSSGSTQTLSATDDIFSDTNEWLFYAVTYDGTTGSFSVYAGSTETSVFLLESTTLTSTSSTVFATEERVFIGNSSGSDSPFDGLLDDIRVYTDGGAANASGALNLTQLESIRASAIPEASSTALLVGLSGLMLAMLRRRRSLGR